MAFAITRAACPCSRPVGRRLGQGGLIDRCVAALSFRSCVPGADLSVAITVSNLSTARVTTRKIINLVFGDFGLSDATGFAEFG